MLTSLVGFIAGVMILNLEGQKIMDGVQSVLVRGLDPYAPTVWQLLKAVRNLSPPVLHLCDARWQLAVDEHRDGEVAIREHRRYVRQVGTDCLHVLSILAVAHRDFDCAPVRHYSKMVRRTVVRETHRLIAVLHYIGLMRFVHRAGLHVLRC